MENNKNILVLTTLSCAILGFIVPLIVWFLNKDNTEFVGKKYLTDLLNFELTLFIIGLILTVINVVPLLGQLISGLGCLIVMIANIIIVIMATIKLTKDEEYKFPMAMELIK
ncbi:MAG: DUF4870 domain-containing protein [Cyanobacteria bacterium SIG29]|nr:DUF4870 domain-containing protein [Cyanobacteria bacterium SIG29]